MGLRRDTTNCDMHNAFGEDFGVESCLSRICGCLFRSMCGGVVALIRLCLAAPPCDWAGVSGRERQASAAGHRGE